MGNVTCTSVDQKSIKIVTDMNGHEMCALPSYPFYELNELRRQILVDTWETLDDKVCFLMVH